MPDLSPHDHFVWCLRIYIDGVKKIFGESRITDSVFNLVFSSGDDVTTMRDDVPSPKMIDLQVHSPPFRLPNLLI